MPNGIWNVYGNTRDEASDEYCRHCGTGMVRRIRTDFPSYKGSPTFQAEWFHCPKCNCMRKMIPGAAYTRNEQGFAEFKRDYLDCK